MSRNSIVVLVLCNLAACILFFSWVSTQKVVKEPDGDKRLVYKEEASFWKNLDFSTFNSLNGQLKDSKAKQTFWAHTNRRVFDLVSALAMVLIYGLYVLRGSKEERIERIKGGLYMSVCMLAALGFVQVLHSIFEVGRLSPTKIPLEGAIRLSEYEHIKFDLKDASKQSFPGDHSAVLFIIAAFITYYAKRFYSVAAILVAATFILPRIVGGGHWMTDIFVGGGALTLITVSWALCTPLQGKFYKWLHKPAAKLTVLVDKIIPPSYSPQVQDAS